VPRCSGPDLCDRDALAARRGKGRIGLKKMRGMAGAVIEEELEMPL